MKIAGNSWPELPAGLAALVLHMQPPDVAVGLPNRQCRQYQRENAHDYGQRNEQPRRAEEQPALRGADAQCGYLKFVGAAKDKNVLTINALPSTSKVVNQ